ncbi:MAG: tetratricopeptide repeat protein [Pirellulales bacterium]|nr:tetratricopeptide repeat protein [Pirellulales bacterium]
MPAPARWGGAFLLLVLVIVALRFEIVDSPPYYDFATGLFLEASYLADSGFNYTELFYEQRRWMEGGAAVYITSVVPTFVAALMVWLPSTRSVLVSYHLITFAAAATLALLMFAALRTRTGNWGAATVAACLLTVPLLSTQIDMCGMDLPLAALALAAVLLVARRYYGWSAVVAAGAFLIKTPGRAVVAATILYLLGLVVLGAGIGTAAERRRQWRGLGWHLLIFAVELAIIDWTNSLPHSQIETWSRSREYFRGENFWNWMPYWFPDQLVVFFASLLGLVVVGAWDIRRRLPGSTTPHGIAWRRVAYQLLLDEPILIVGWTIILGMLSALWFVYCLPRYFMIILPFLYLTVGTLLLTPLRTRSLGVVLLVGMALFNLANAHGDFFPAIDRQPYDAWRTGAMLERSREYLRDHRSNVAGMHKLARLHPQAIVIASSPYVHFLSLPRLGYVARPLQGYSLSRYHGGSFQSGLKLQTALPRDVVFVRVQNSFTTGEVPLPAPGDSMIWDDRLTNPNSPLLIFRRQWPASIANSELAARYQMIVLPAKGLVEQGHVAAREGRFADALAIYFRALDDLAGQPGSPLEVDAHFGLAYVYFQQQRWTEAVRHLEEVTRLDSRRAAAFDLLGRALSELNRWEEAATAFRVATELDRGNFDAWKGLAQAEIRRQQYAAAAAALAEAARVRPDDAVLAYLQGSTCYQAGDLPGAVRAFERALALRADWPEANNELAWLMATTTDDTLRNPARAVQLAEAACAVNFRQEANLLDTLAAAYAADGRFADAVAVAREAIERATENKQDKLAAEIAARLALYERREPYRSPPVAPPESTPSLQKKHS